MIEPSPRQKSEAVGGAQSSGWIRAQSFIPGIALLCSAAWFGLSAARPWILFDFPVDDAWIHRVYAQAFAWGHGFQYNLGGPQEAGSSSPLWVIVTAPAHWLDGLGNDAVVVVVKLIGLLLAFILVRTTQRVALTTTGSTSAAAIAGTMLAIDPRLLVSTFGGMEPLLLVCLWMGAFEALLRRRWWLATVLLGLGPIARPEAVVLVPLALPVLLGGVWKELTAAKSIAMGALLGAPLLGWGLFCRFANGHWLPTTFYIKAHAFKLNGETLHAAFVFFFHEGYPPLLLIAGCALFLIALIIAGQTQERPTAGATFFFGAGLVAYFLGVAGTRYFQANAHDWQYYFARWLDPAGLVLSFGFSIGWAWLLTGAQTAQQMPSAGPLLARRSVQLAVTALSAAVLFLSLPALAGSLQEQRTRFDNDAHWTHQKNVVVGEWIKANVAPDATVGVDDAGAIRYFGKRKTIDLGGLNTARVAFGPPMRPEELDWIAIFPMFHKKSSLLPYFDPKLNSVVISPDCQAGDCLEDTKSVMVLAQRE